MAASSSDCRRSHQTQERAPHQSAPRPAPSVPESRTQTPALHHYQHDLQQEACRPLPQAEELALLTQYQQGDAQTRAEARTRLLSSNLRYVLMVAFQVAKERGWSHDPEKIQVLNQAGYDALLAALEEFRLEQVVYPERFRLLSYAHRRIKRAIWQQAGVEHTQEQSLRPFAWHDHSPWLADTSAGAPATASMTRRNGEPMLAASEVTLNAPYWQLVQQQTDHAGASVDETRLQALLNLLTPEQRQVLVVYVRKILSGHDPIDQDVASMLGLGRSAVTRRRLRLRAHLGVDQEDIRAVFHYLIDQIRRGRAIQ